MDDLPAQICRICGGEATAVITHDLDEITPQNLFCDEHAVKVMQRHEIFQATAHMN